VTDPTSKPDPSIGPTMQAVRLHTPGGPEALVLEEIETPSLRPGDALVRVAAAGITRGELEWPVDRLPATPSYEVSGDVVAVAPGVESVAIGDAVYALTGFDRDGAAADYVAVPAAFLAPKPRTVDHIGAAAVPMAALSAWQGLFDHGHLEEGQRVLIHGAAGGVGHLATQLARWRGAYVLGTASSASVEAARMFGAHEVIEGTCAGVAGAFESVDLVFDTVGGELLRASQTVIREGGRLVSVAEEPQEPAVEDKIEAVYFVVEPNRDQLLDVARLVDGGDLRPAIDSVFPLADAVGAFGRSMARAKSGKVVFRVAEEDVDD
jgi:NADPH:quinone reductase-like Zn-dependent oxidoreductase